MPSIESRYAINRILEKKHKIIHVYGLAMQFFGLEFGGYYEIS